MTYARAACLSFALAAAAIAALAVEYRVFGAIAAEGGAEIVEV